LKNHRGSARIRNRNTAFCIGDICLPINKRGLLPVLALARRILHLLRSDEYPALMDTAGVEMNATLALIGAGVLFCIGLVLCMAAAFKRKAKPDIEPDERNQEIKKAT
jgi:hypothetical protein